MPYYRKLCGEKCFLSPVQVEDAEAWTVWMNDLEVSLPLGDEAYTTIGFDRMRDDAAEAIRAREHIFSIVDSESNRLVGRCLLFGIDPVNHSAMLGIVIGAKADWNQGYGTEATRLLLDYAFNLLNLHSIMLGTFAFNTRAIHAYEKIGFRPIGCRREARIIAGKAWDVILMDMLAEEFRALWHSVIPALVQDA